MSLRLVNAEFLKLRKRRGLVIAVAALTIVPMLIAYTVILSLHASDPVKNGPAGGLQNFTGSMEMLGLLSVVAAILVGATLGTGDLGSGVFRELVVTGRSRLALFAARVPAGLALLAPIVGGAFAITATASSVFTGAPRTGSEGVQDFTAPAVSVLLESAGWLGLMTAVSFVLALGVSSIVSSRGTAIGVLLAWWLVAMPVLQAMGKLGSLREGLPGSAIERLGPEALTPDPAVSMSLAAAVAVLAAWVVVPLGAGAWRTATRDA
jgi:ABC-type transport system involved in multi-copper enzyme maturation permease subunit